MSWEKGKWVHFTYINRLGYECGFQGYVESVEEFHKVIARYRIEFADVLDFEVDGVLSKANEVKGWFPDAR